MPKYTVECTYHLPIYKHHTITAPTPEAACQKAIDRDDWKNASESYDSCGPTYISGLWQGADAAYMGPAVPIPPAMGEEPPESVKRLLDALQVWMTAENPDGPSHELAQAMSAIRAEFPGYVAPRIGEPA